jgi:hypothetical protein
MNGNAPVQGSARFAHTRPDSGFRNKETDMAIQGRGETLVRRIRLGMVGGGNDAFIGDVHRRCCGTHA